MQICRLLLQQIEKYFRLRVPRIPAGDKHRIDSWQLPEHLTPFADRRFHLSVGELRPPVGVAKRLERAHAGALGERVGGAQGDAVVGRGRLHECPDHRA